MTKANSESRLKQRQSSIFKKKIRQHEIELIWSYILDYENLANPYENRKRAILEWKGIAVINGDESPEIVKKAAILQRKTIHCKDALHVACAIWAECDVLLTADDRILKKSRNFDEIKLFSPLTLMTSLENNDES